jgi:hypothetical protein
VAVLVFSVKVMRHTQRIFLWKTSRASLENSRSSGGAKISAATLVPLEIPRPAGKNAGSSG